MSKGQPIADTTVEIDTHKLDGCEPQLVVRVLNKGTGATLGEAFYNPDRAEELAVEILRMANNIRIWTGEAEPR